MAQGLYRRDVLWEGFWGIECEEREEGLLLCTLEDSVCLAELSDFSDLADLVTDWVAGSGAGSVEGGRASSGEGDSDSRGSPAGTGRAERAGLPASGAETELPDSPFWTVGDETENSSKVGVSPETLLADDEAGWEEFPVASFEASGVASFDALFGAPDSACAPAGRDGGAWLVGPPWGSAGRLSEEGGAAGVPAVAG